MTALTEILASWYPWVLSGMALLAPVVFVVLLFVSAPYGRHVRQGWGPAMNSRLAWLLMESPACLLMILLPLVFLGPAGLSPVIVVLLVAWQVHYFHRAFVYPFTLRTTRRMPVLVMLMAFCFNLANGFLNGFHFVMNADLYSTGWLTTPLAMAGLLLFAAGYVITKQSDRILRDLREAGEDYGIPHGGLYQYVSCPNYLGESIQWLGWALLVQSSAGWVFLAWTLANLVPRAVSHHRWYRDTFPEYPDQRRAIIPGLL